jgi:hypothetical protein
VYLIKKKMATKKKTTGEDSLKSFISTAGVRGETSYRPGSTSSLTLKEQLCNIQEGILPYNKQNRGGCTYISIGDVITLSQKAYFNIAVYRNTIDTQTEFCNSKLHFRGGSDKSRTFFEAWYKKIKGPDLSEQFFREYYRSSNFFAYKTYYTIDSEELKRLRNEFGAAEIPNNLLNKKIPLRYVVLNPADICCEGSLSFSDLEYSKLLNDYELSRLKNASTPEELEFLNSLDPKTKKGIKDGSSPIIKLHQDRLISVFAKKQDYEPFSIPIYYPVLFDLNLKLQFKKAEIAVAKTVDYLILLITLGDKDNGVDAKTALALQEIFKKDSVERVMIADYTTKAEFIIPDLNKILGPQKYEVVNRDIASGLMNIFYEDQKFASGLIKTKIFLERLNEARQAYLNRFLIPEMEKIAEEISLRDIPTPVFEQIDVQDEIQLQKNYLRLVELGIITPEEFFEASETGLLPDGEQSVESQTEYKKLRDKGLYKPLLGGATDEAGAGRPGGAKAPQTKKTVSPQKSVGFSMTKIKDSAIAISRLSESVEVEFKKKNKLQRLSAKNKNAAYELTKAIVANETPDKWGESVANYVNDPMTLVKTPREEVLEMAAEHGVEPFLGFILLNSKTEINEQNKD